MPKPAEDEKNTKNENPHADVPVLDPNFRIELPMFEGPLDLLLHLIKKHELDILDLPISFVTEKYVEYLSLLEQLNLDVASEYLVMAATLAHIKSKQLLPPDPSAQDDDLEDEEDLDPRGELIRRLLQYQKYKNAAEQLVSRGVDGRDVFGRGMDVPKEVEGPAPLAELSVFRLIDAFQKIVKRRQGDISLEIDAERVSISERIEQITEHLQSRKKMPFVELFDGYATTYDLVVTFLALLEMAKMRLMRIYQSEPDAPIYVQPRSFAEDENAAAGEVPEEPEEEPEVEEEPTGRPAPFDPSVIHDALRDVERRQGSVTGPSDAAVMDDEEHEHEVDGSFGRGTVEGAAGETATFEVVGSEDDGGAEDDGVSGEQDIYWDPEEDAESAALWSNDDSWDDDVALDPEGIASADDGQDEPASVASAPTGELHLVEGSDAEPQGSEVPEDSEDLAFEDNSGHDPEPA